MEETGFKLTVPGNGEKKKIQRINSVGDKLNSRPSSRTSVNNDKKMTRSRPNSARRQKKGSKEVTVDDNSDKGD